MRGVQETGAVMNAATTSQRDDAWCSADAGCHMTKRKWVERLVSMPSGRRAYGDVLVAAEMDGSVLALFGRTTESRRQWNGCGEVD